MGWNLSDIKTKVRNLTGTPSTDQLADADLVNYINNYYVFSMPMELKEQIQLNFLDFKVFPGKDIYPFPGGFFTDQPMAYADGFPMIFYQDPDMFYQDFPQQYAVDNLSVGNGGTTNFTGGLQYPPVIPGSCYITDGIQVLQDDGFGAFTGDGFGTLNYITGAYNITFTIAPATTQTIYSKYQGYTGNRPQAVLFFNNQFTMRPIPDQVYQIRMQGYIKPLSLSSDSDVPMQEEWGQVIAYGASLDIFSDRGDIEAYNEMFSIFKRFENVALSRTVEQYQSLQSVPRF